MLCYVYRALLDQGHDGIVRDGKIVNDLSINSLVKQAVMQAKAGADIVAPSGMFQYLLIIYLVHILYYYIYYYYYYYC